MVNHRRYQPGASRVAREVRLRIACRAR